MAFLSEGEADTAVFPLPLHSAAKLGQVEQQLRRRLPDTQRHLHASLGKIGQRNGFQHGPIADKGHAVACFFDFAQEVGIEENGRALLSQPIDYIMHQPPPQWVQTRGRLV